MMREAITKDIVINTMNGFHYIHQEYNTSSPRLSGRPTTMTSVILMMILTFSSLARKAILECSQYLELENALPNYSLI
jgi:hypothetical protein